MVAITNRAFLFLLAAGLLGIPLTLIYNRMINECGKAGPDGEYVSEYFGYPGKVFRTVSAYRAQCPAGRLHIIFLTLLVPTAICLITFISLAFG
jgi:hypothetical protein